MAFATSKWFTDDELSSDDQPEELRPGWSRETALERGRSEREAVKHRLYAEGEIDLGNILNDCGLPMPLVCVCCGNENTVETACRKRWCPACAWSIQRKRIDRYAGAVKLMQWPAFLTLTMTNSPDPETIRDLRKSWGRMRRRKMFEGQVKGGVAAIEVTNDGNGWHPHLHAVIDCEWLSATVPAPHWSDSHDVRLQKMEMAQMELSRVWADVIGQEQAICWITRMRNLDRLIYSLKYACKGSQLAECADRIGPLIRALDKSRLVSAFGNLHGRTAEMDADERPTRTCSECGNESSFLPTAVIYSITRRDPADVVGSIPVTLGQPAKPHHRINHTPTGNPLPTTSAPITPDDVGPF